MASIKLSKRELFHLFLVGALPIHLWSIFLVLRDFSWVIEQTSLGFAIGYLAYSLLVALIESGLFFIAMFILGLMLPRQWGSEKTLAILCVMALVIGLWGIANQTYFLLQESPLAVSTWIVQRLNYHQELGFSLLAIATLASILMPIVFIQRSETLKNAVLKVTDRVVVLSGLYLSLDLLAVIVIVLRNLPS